MEGNRLVAITSDIDWAGDEVISYMLAILDDYGIRATFFCTHDVSSIKGIERHELAIHPNFTAGRAEVEVIRELKTLFPEAKGIRSHGLYLHGYLFNIYREFGLEYDSNYLIPNQMVHPFYISENVLEIPMFFEDDLYVSTSSDFTIASLNMQSEGLTVFNFHPIHIFLNTRRLSDYDHAKKYFRQPHRMLKYRNKGKGMHDLFIELLEYIKSHHLRTCTLSEINSCWRRHASHSPNYQDYSEGQKNEAK